MGTVSLHSYSQCTSTQFSVNQVPTVVGTHGAVNTQYRRTNVLPGVDMVMTIVSLNNGAALSQEDDPDLTAGAYLAAWQPTVTPLLANNGDGGITWNISFFVNGSLFLTPYRFSCLSVLAVDIDGNNFAIREYVEAVNPYSFSGQSSGTFLTYTTTANSLRTTASSSALITNIDSTEKHAMVSYRFINTTGFTYTTGYTKTDGNTLRQFSLFFNTATTFPDRFVRYFNSDNDVTSTINEATDIDDDNDGIIDTKEYPAGYADPFGDADGDGIGNYMDPTPGAIGNTFVDSNGDGINDNYDIDRDGLVNSIDLDSDNDGIPDLVEAGGVDTNGNGTIDVLTDADNDGLLDVYDSNSGGDAIANLDTDADGVPNFRDLDSDNDGIPDVVEAGAIDANNDGMRDGYTDTDSDGFADAVDGDANNDGTAENTAAALIITGTDTDSDGVPNSYPRANADANGLPNPYDLDSDGDGILDVREAGLTDATNDGIADGTLGADGWSDTVDALPTFTPTNSDTDSRPNYLDIDADNDGISDNVEGQTTAGFIAPSNMDSDADGIDNAYDNNDAGLGGNAGNGIAPNNHDAADQPDYIDIDTDNDGNLDRREGNDWNGNGYEDENTTLTNVDTDGDGLDNVFDLVTGPDVSIVGYTGGTGSRSTAQQTPPGATDRDWRNQLHSLPVTLISFSTEESNGFAILNWVTDNELNFQAYIIERSINRRDFAAVGTVNPSNNGNRNNYQFTDDLQLINSRVVYYRLKMVDVDAKFKYSLVLRVTKNSITKKGISITPNPVTDNVQLKISSDVQATAGIQIINASGQVFYQSIKGVVKGDNLLYLQALTGKLVKGIYVVNVTIEGQLMSTKFVY